MCAYVFVFNTNTFCVYSCMWNEWHTSWKDQIDKRNKRRSSSLIVKWNWKTEYDMFDESFNEEKIIISFHSSYRQHFNYYSQTNIYDLSSLWEEENFMCVFFLFISDPIFSFLGHNKHSILYSRKFKRRSNGNSISKFRHLYIRYNMHMHE
jgi:hypothetical protein